MSERLPTEFPTASITDVIIRGTTNLAALPPEAYGSRKDVPPSDLGLDGAIPLPPESGWHPTPDDGVTDTEWATQNRRINDLLMGARGMSEWAADWAWCRSCERISPFWKVARICVWCKTPAAPESSP